MTSKIGVGVIGVGLIGQKRIAASGGELDVRAIHDVRSDTAEAVGRRTGIVVEPTLDRLLGRPDIDLVVVATTHDQLTSIGKEAIERGKHVFLEKPGGVASAELRSLASASVAHGRIVRVGFNHRFHPALLKARDLVLHGGYGKLLWIRGRYGHGGRPGYEAEWRADRSRSGGGELVDQGSHLVDLVRYFAGDVELAFAELPTLFWPMDVEDNAFLAVRPLAGGLAWLHASWTEWKNLFHFEITLDRAKIEINGLGGSYGTERLTLHEMQPEMGPPFTTTWEWPFADGSWKAEMDDVVSVIHGGHGIGASVDDAINVLEVIEEAYRS